MRRTIVLVLFALVLPIIVPAPSDARVVRLVGEQTRLITDGKSYGEVGPYERLDGTVYIEVDPRDPLNAMIVNLDKAPKTPKGMVGFTTPFFILKPVDMARGNHKISYGVNNRGNKGHLGRMTAQPVGPNTNNPLTAADVNDDNLLTRFGYTYVDAGWQGNIAPGNNRLVPNLPVATQSDRRPIVSKIRVEFADVEGFTRTLEGTEIHVTRVPYETADMDPAH